MLQVATLTIAATAPADHEGTTSTMAKTPTTNPILRPLRSAQARVRKFAFRTTLGPMNANPYADEAFPYSKRPH